jgi:ubiquinone/menaquinone biosynthesis C-methylase UbiE
VARRSEGGRLERRAWAVAAGVAVERTEDDVARERTLSRAEARRFYDRLGARQDTQAYYEDPPNRDLAAHLELASARAIVELGCGTGRFATETLLPAAPDTCAYHGLDLSATMVALARQRLAFAGPRASVAQTDGAMALPGEAGRFDRFVSTYVLDLLPRDDIRALASEVVRALRPGGLAGVTSLTHGRRGLARGVSWLWERVQARMPALVGGCRPLDLRPLLAAPELIVEHEAHHTVRGLSSQVLVLRRR